MTAWIPRPPVAVAAFFVLSTAVAAQVPPLPDVGPAVPVSHIETGASIYDGCLAGATTDEGASTLRYVVGLTDAFSMMHAMGRQDGVCVPSGVNAGQLFGIACQYLAAHRISRTMDAATLVFLAETAAYPCRQKVLRTGLDNPLTDSLAPSAPVVAALMRAFPRVTPTNVND